MSDVEIRLAVDLPAVDGRCSVGEQLAFVEAGREHDPVFCGEVADLIDGMPLNLERLGRTRTPSTVAAARGSNRAAADAATLVRSCADLSLVPAAIRAERDAQVVWRDGESASWAQSMSGWASFVEEFVRLGVR